MGHRHAGRPSRQRRKTTVYLADEDREAIRTVQHTSGTKTAAAAIRYALHAATREPPDTTAIAGRILKWADTLKFVSRREQRELWGLSFELYNLINESE